MKGICRCNISPKSIDFFELNKKVIILCGPELIKGTESFLRSETLSMSLALKTPMKYAAMIGEPILQGIMGGRKLSLSLVATGK